MQTLNTKRNQDSKNYFVLLNLSDQIVMEILKIRCLIYLYAKGISHMQLASILDCIWVVDLTKKIFWGVKRFRNIS